MIRREPLCNNINKDFLSLVNELDDLSKQNSQKTRTVILSTTKPTLT